METLSHQCATLGPSGSLWDLQVPPPVLMRTLGLSMFLHLRLCALHTLLNSIFQSNPSTLAHISPSAFTPSPIIHPLGAFPHPPPLLPPHPRPCFHNSGTT